ncbi:MAG: HAMP domain-containing sensor histidine kinase [Gordonia sp. (in: high G+C Gram-positive bacteria)]
MRKRILKMTIASLLAVGVLLGVPLTILSWVWIADSAHQNLSERVKTISEHVLAEEAAGLLRSPDDLQLDQFHLLVPKNGQLTLTTSSGSRWIGVPIDGRQLSESVTLGPHATLKLSIPASTIRPSQLLAVTVVVLVIAASIAGGALVAIVIARRLTEPLTRVAGRAAAMARGDLSSAWPHYGIDELDRVSEALSDANTEIALRLEREGEIIGDVSHQLRSRLTAIGLRLDELTLHEDPAVVAEAEAGVAQVERLADELDEMVAASRQESVAVGDIDVTTVVDTLVRDFSPPFAAAGRTVSASFGASSRTVVGRPGRLREALSVLIDNALNHGGGACTVRVDELASADMVRITVADEGPGIADEIAADIFGRGFSGGARSGVGLSLARALVGADGGRLDLVSRRPPVFAVVVPLSNGAAETAQPVRRARVPHR